jgi:hypothetical protein
VVPPRDLRRILREHMAFLENVPEIKLRLPRTMADDPVCIGLAVRRGKKENSQTVLIKPLSCFE